MRKKINLQVRDSGKVGYTNMDINDKIKEVSEKISRQLERDIEIFGSSYLEIGELSIKRIDPTNVMIKSPAEVVIVSLSN